MADAAKQRFQLIPAQGVITWVSVIRPRLGRRCPGRVL